MFRSAQPIWPAGRDRDMNITVAFHVTVEVTRHEPVIVYLAASTLYRLTVNAAFRAWGPARGPHEFYRVDILDITHSLGVGPNRVVIEVAGYNANSFWTLNQRSFLQAEIRCGDKVLASTGGTGLPFTATLGDARVQRVQRYSFQRTFTESYRFAEGGLLTWRSAASKDAALECAVRSPKKLLTRNAPYPDYSLCEPTTCVSFGTVTVAQPSRLILRPRFVANIGPKLLGYREDELETRPYLDFQRFGNRSVNASGQGYVRNRPHRLSRYEFSILDFGKDITGFIGMHVKTETPTKIYVTFDEELRNDDVDFTRLDCANVIEFSLHPGEYDLLSFEPYTMRFLKTTVMEGACAVSGVYLREYKSPAGLDASFRSSDAELDELFSAARETYRQNSVDLFTDCPSRERAGWLCDSFFTSRASLVLSGSIQMERTFLQNFLLASHFAFIPEGMLPMCYPADHYDGAYIVNWAMWFVLQVEEYLRRSGDRRMADDLKPRIMALCQYLRGYRNADGLLENLGRYVWVDDSHANQFVEGLSYPTNMLYTEMLDCVTRMYGPILHEVDTKKLRATIRSQSFDGNFFIDNATRQNGVLVPTENRSEACQYYAFYFGIADTERDSKLWSTLRDEFKVRGQLANYPNIARCDIIFGGILRFELLSRGGLTEQLLQECKARLLFMARQTGTLWEHDTDRASLNHAFESHTAYLLYRDGLGVRQIDQPKKRIQLHFTRCGLEHCEGQIPTLDGPVSVRWKRKLQMIQYRCEVPSGYFVDVSTADGLNAVSSAQIG
jgi:alpha-L-rhamnosidase